MSSENQKNNPELNRSNWDIIVVGSGFGGSVSALRLAEKGYRVLVIEKGKRYYSEDFPKNKLEFEKIFLDTSNILLWHSVYYIAQKYFCSSWHWRW